MPDFLQNKYFYYFIIPVLTILLTTFVKVVSRNDRFSLNMRADLAFGLDLSISAILLLTSHTLTYIAANAKNPDAELIDCINKISTIPLIMLGLFLFLWIQSTIIRKLGWENSETMSWVWGVTIPNTLGLLALIFIAYWINNRL